MISTMDGRVWTGTRVDGIYELFLIDFLVMISDQNAKIMVIPSVGGCEFDPIGIWKEYVL